MMDMLAGRSFSLVCGNNTIKGGERPVNKYLITLKCFSGSGVKNVKKAPPVLRNSISKRLRGGKQKNHPSQTPSVSGCFFSQESPGGGMGILPMVRVLGRKGLNGNSKQRILDIEHGTTNTEQKKEKTTGKDARATSGGQRILNTEHRIMNIEQRERNASQPQNRRWGFTGWKPVPPLMRLCLFRIREANRVKRVHSIPLLGLC